MQIVWLVLPALLGTLCGALLCLAFTRRIRPVWLLLCALYLSFDILVLVYTPRYPNLHWNWPSKLASTLLGILAFFALRLSPREVGFALPRTRSAWTWTAFGILGAMAFDGTLNYIFRTHQPPTLETLLYQATMPGIAEELSYRGIAFALVRRAFREAPERWSNLAAVLVPSVVFGLAHGYAHVNGVSHFDWFGFVYTFALGLWLAWTRLRTGSLLGPVLAHNAANTTGNWLRGFR